MAIAQPVTRYDLDRDVRTVEAMAARLTPYVYENELYGLMPGDLPKLTIGGLLMRLHRLSAISGTLAPKQREAVQKAQQQLDEVRREWTVAYEGKITREFQARLTALNQFLNEYADNPRSASENYPSEAEKRTILEALTDEAANLNVLTSDMKNALGATDNKIRRYTQPSGFIWDERLRPAYPQDKYWFLYAK
jgi:hypothetical protein